MTTLAVTPLSAPRVRLSPAAAAAIAFAALYVGAVGTSTGQQLDDAAMRWTATVVVSDHWAHALLTMISATSVLLVGLVIAALTALVRGLRAAALGASGGAVVLVGAEVLKLALTRPDLTIDALANSFPSGHVAAVTGLTVALMLVTPSGRWRWCALLPAVPAVVLTGLATVVLQWHRPSEVLGSMLLGVVVGVIAWSRDSPRHAATTARCASQPNHSPTDGAARGHQAYLSSQPPPRTPARLDHESPSIRRSP